MKVLIISDDPEKDSFRPIKILRDSLQNKIKNKVDLFALSPQCLFLNDRVISERADVSTVLEKLEDVLKSGFYSLYVVSLKAENFKKIFPSERKDFLEMTEKYSKNSTVFIFGAPSILSNIKKFHEELEINLFLKPRPGVAKITDELKKQILNYI